MVKFVVGNAVAVMFPFSDLSGQKLRPALVLAEVEFGNLILCQITSKPYTSKTAIKLIQEDFAEGGLPIASYIRPDKLFTAEPSIIEKTLGRLNDPTRRTVLLQVQSLFNDVS
ncbi:MAG TPA: type II toxin-antitoxin system PemK/MazF family toxin [Candidatus Saccharimonadales bacterium]|nr:type II toxin-antitoxin system PemK/MazF family toxin [Candidatus Saccharimonadales bacterium]